MSRNRDDGIQFFRDFRIDVVLRDILGQNMVVGFSHQIDRKVDFPVEPLEHGIEKIVGGLDGTPPGVVGISQSSRRNHIPDDFFHLLCPICREERAAGLVFDISQQYFRRT